MKKTTTINRIILFTICMSLPMLMFAQADPPGDTPIDGGLSLLLAAGAAYGAKKYRDHKKKQGAEEEVK